MMCSVFMIRSLRFPQNLGQSFCALETRSDFSCETFGLKDKEYFSFLIVQCKNDNFLLFLFERLIKVDGIFSTEKSLQNTHLVFVVKNQSPEKLPSV